MDLKAELCDTKFKLNRAENIINELMDILDDCHLDCETVNETLVSRLGYGWFEDSDDESDVESKNRETLNPCKNIFENDDTGSNPDDNVVFNTLFCCRWKSSCRWSSKTQLRTSFPHLSS